MSSQQDGFRSRRSQLTPSPRAAVALTQANSPVGAVLAEHLRRAGHAVTGLDTAPGESAEITWQPADLSSPMLVDVLAGQDAVIHLTPGAQLSTELAEEPVLRRARLVRELQTLTVASAAAGVSHLVVVTSAMIYGARPDNPAPLPEDSPLRSSDAEGMVADLVDLEALLDVAREVHPTVLVTSVRPAALVGPGVDSIVTRHFEAPRLLALRGSDPQWQFCHVEDLSRALLTVLEHRLGPVVTVGAPGSLSLQDVEVISGMRHVSVPPSAAHAAADRLHRLGVLRLPATDLAYIADPWVIDSARLTNAGWRAEHDNADCLRELAEQVRDSGAARRVDRRDAALGAAGAASAAVAVVATAAVLRRRRRRS